MQYESKKVLNAVWGNVPMHASSRREFILFLHLFSDIDVGTSDMDDSTSSDDEPEADQNGNKKGRCSWRSHIFD